MFQFRGALQYFKEETDIKKMAEIYYSFTSENRWGILAESFKQN